MIRYFALLMILPLVTSCSSIVFDPGDGSETVVLHSINHPRDFDLVYLRTPEEGPIRIRQNTWTYFYSIPVNRLEVVDWIYFNLPENTEAANLKAETWTPWWGYFLLIPTLGIVRVDKVTCEFDPVRVTFPGTVSQDD